MTFWRFTRTTRVVNESNVHRMRPERRGPYDALKLFRLRATYWCNISRTRRVALLRGASPRPFDEVRIFPRCASLQSLWIHDRPLLPLPLNPSFLHSEISPNLHTRTLIAMSPRVTRSAAASTQRKTQQTFQSQTSGSEPLGFAPGVSIHRV